MAAYTDLTSVKNKLPASLPATLSDSVITGFIVDASGEVDDGVGPRYSRQYKSNTQKFPDVTDSPSTPASVKLCATWLAVSECYEKIGESNRGNEPGASEPNKSYYRRKAEGVLSRILNGEIDLSVAAATRAAAIGERYPDDESTLDRVFTNTEMDYLY
jgi:hypothetical protein